LAFCIGSQRGCLAIPRLEGQKINTTYNELTGRD